MEIDDSFRIVIDCLEIGGLGLIVMILSYLWRLRYETEGYRQYVVDNAKGFRKFIWIGALLLTALVIKLVLAGYFEGHPTDMNCFISWADWIYDSGPSGFYELDAFTDYPPGYMLILWIIENISRLFSIESFSIASRVMTKLVPVLADLGAGYIIWRMAKERFSEGSSFLLAGLYIFSPIVIMDSSVWGQTDSVFTFCVLLTGWLCMKKKRIPAYFVFVLGVFIKPQTLMFAPILIWTIIEQVFLDGFNWKKFRNDLIGGVCAIGSFFLMSLPFGIGTVVNQYVETLGEYPYASVNAYNIWAFLGKNWASQDDVVFGLPAHVWGSIAILAAVGLSAFAFFRLRKRADMSRYFVSMSIIISTMFLFSVRMHERYLFPIVVLLLAAFVVKPARELYACFVGFAFLLYLNVAHIYKVVTTIDGATPPSGGFIGLVALLSIGMYAYMWFAIWRPCSVLDFVSEIKSKGRRAAQRFVSIKSEDEQKKKLPREKFSIRATKKMPRMTRTDWIVMFGIILFYGLIALVNLGSTSAPQTEWNNLENKDPLVFDLGGDRHIDMIYMYLGHYEGRQFTLDLSQDGVNYDTLGVVKANDVFHWNALASTGEGASYSTYNLSHDYRYVRLTPIDGECYVREIIIADPARNTAAPVNADQYPELFDEQDTFEYPATWRSGTYFDEIYHARTAQEMIDGEYCYENTHPPLGKWLMSLGIRVFGMTPFGWRVVGVLFGIGMLPLLYLFARRLFNGQTWAAGVATGLFAFDFMHFTQTRIATIDTYGTFFIIAMFFFMYWYSQMSFYDTKLIKTFVPLLGAAVSMGLGCASKWTAVYASAGMGIFFFAVMVRRYREYRIAKANPSGRSDGIDHSHIIEVWPKYFIITIVVCVFLFVVLAGLLYLLSYIPFSNGQDMSLWDRMIKNQTDMYNYHANLDATHPYSSVWYEWPTMIRPMFYYSGTTLDGLKEGISAFGNPLVWWAGIPAFFYIVYRTVRYSDGKAMFLGFAYMVQLAPWIMVTRCTFAYHYFPSVPFVVLMIVYSMTKLDEKPDKRWRRWIYVYAGVAVVLFFVFYPVLTGTPVEGNYIRDGLKWLPSWALYI
ncbi:MAG: glycosyltransferase family 39 protein [Eubacterium sp.]|nr:glycosyltransferase family 39 protein [Eubacterium sp.]